MRPKIVRIFFAALLSFAPAYGQSPGTWRQIGPNPIDASSQFSSTKNATVSGLVTDIAVDPRGSVDKVIYIATGASGVWKTVDGGASWTSKTDGLPVLTMGAVVLDPANPDIVYAGIGGFYCCSEGGGLYRSDDAGEHWTSLNPGGIFSNKQIKRMVMPAAARC